MIDKTICEVLWRNISDFYVNLRVEVAADNNKTSVEEVAQLDGKKNHTYSLPADLQPPNATQDYQQNTHPMIETPTGTNTTNVPFF